jgi:hypothetical protein
MVCPSVLMFGDGFPGEVKISVGVVGRDVSPTVEVVSERPDGVDEGAGAVEGLQRDDEGHPGDVWLLPVGEAGRVPFGEFAPQCFGDLEDEGLFRCRHVVGHETLQAC